MGHRVEHRRTRAFVDGHDCGIVHGLDQGAADVCALTPHLPDGLSFYETKAILVCCVLCVSVCACAGSSTAPYCGCVGAPSDDVQSHGHIQPQVGRRIAFVAQWGFDDVNDPTTHPPSTRVVCTCVIGKHIISFAHSTQQTRIAFVS